MQKGTKLVTGLFISFVGIFLMRYFTKFYSFVGTIIFIIGLYIIFKAHNFNNKYL